jgi:hypothetical protein
MKRIPDNFRIVINHSLRYLGIIITQLEKAGSYLPGRHKLIENVFVVVGVAGPYNAVREQSVVHGIRTAGATIPYFVGNAPPLQIPHPVVFKSQFYPALIPYAV